MNRLRHPILLLMSTLVLLSSFCSCGKDPEFIRVENPKIIGLQDSTLVFQFDFVAFNPNKIKVKLKSAQMDVYYKNELVGQGSIVDKLLLPANDTIVLPVVCKIPMDQLQRYFPELITTENAQFSIRGFNRIGVSFIRVKNQIEQTVLLDTKGIFKRAMQDIFQQNDDGLSIKHFRWDQMPSLSGTRMSMELTIKNPMPFDYTLQDLELTFATEGNEQPFVQWKLDLPVLQRADTETVLPIKAKIDHFQFVKNAKLSWIFKQSGTFRVRGTMTLSINGTSFLVPVDQVVDVGS